VEAWKRSLSFVVVVVVAVVVVVVVVVVVDSADIPDSGSHFGHFITTSTLMS